MRRAQPLRGECLPADHPLSDPIRHLPATLIASFAKRLARLALFAPPAGVVIVIPFIYNLLKMHPSCMVLIHRDTYGGEELSLSSPVGAAGAFLLADKSRGPTRR